MANKISLAVLLLGGALLWVVPLGGALLLVTGAVELAIRWEDELLEKPVPAVALTPDEGERRTATSPTS
jgi:hypothetical protein